MPLANAVSLLGLVVMLGLAWLLSSHRWKINPRVIIGGLLLQYLLAILILKTSWGFALFELLGRGIEAVITSAEPGLGLVFGESASGYGLAFKVLPLIIVFSSLLAVLYYIRIMPLLVQGMGWVMQRTLGTGGAETLAAAANVFVGQNTAPLVARPYLPTMTNSELMTIMVAGFSTIAVNIMAAYIDMGISATHLLSASVISAPGALLIAKILEPEITKPASGDELVVATDHEATNLVHAVTRGATDGLRIALGVGAMLIAFIALVNLVNMLLATLWPGATLQAGLSWLFWPLAWCMGFPVEDCTAVAELLGLRFVTNEFLAYQSLVDPAWREQVGGLTDRSEILIVYAMCGFANLGSIGVQVGGIGAIIPNREADLARLGFRAMLGGTLASFVGACVVGSIL